MMYYLDLNPNAKEKLQTEIEKMIKSDKDITYENLQKMTYLDYVQRETLRVYPPVIGTLIREVTKDYKHL